MTKARLPMFQGMTLHPGPYEVDSVDLRECRWIGRRSGAWEDWRSRREENGEVDLINMHSIHVCNS